MRSIAYPGRAGGVDAPLVTWRTDRLCEALLAVAAAALCAVAATLTASGATSQDAWLEALARATAVGAPVAVGLYARRRPRSRRFGTLLVLTGFTVFLATLAGASSPQVHAVGRISGWVIEPLLVYLILSFPSGRLVHRFDRRLVGFLVLVLVTLFFPTALLIERYPEPSPWTLCHGGCPDNPFIVTGSQLPIVEEVVRPLREVLLIGILAAATVRVALRFRAASHLVRRTQAPVLAAAALRLASFVGLIGLRRAAPDSHLLAVWMWSLPLGVPLLAVAFMVGLARWRLFVAAKMQRLATRLGSHPRPEDLRVALAESFDDPSLEFVYWGDDPAGWVDAGGRAVSVPTGGSGRCVTEIRDGGQRVAAIVHDEALQDDHAFIDPTTTYAVMALDNHRLGVEASELIAEARDSRARIQATADDERRRIERDLHDGAQQRLVALRIKLELAAERIGGTDARSAELIRRLGEEVDGTLDEVRSLARGIYPPPLADWGLVQGLRSAATQAALPTTVMATAGPKRYSREIESAAYFCCLEAMQNAAKHARDATAVVIDIADNGVLRFEVRDDGAGFDSRAASAGVGLTSMRDRLAAVGGELAIVSAPGKGTRVIGRVSLPAGSHGGSRSEGRDRIEPSATDDR